MRTCDIANKQGGVPLSLWPQSASPTGAKEAEEHEHIGRITQGDARFQRSCRFAAREILTVDKAFQQRAFALKSVNDINERLLRKRAMNADKQADMADGSLPRLGRWFFGMRRVLVAYVLGVAILALLMLLLRHC
jgi:hypothetical protein